ncbi:hypothetical protein MiSe_11740 [Microseira wollei NIES-4236]|uniref:Uncharacterized protein n=1 Tax=Microseira wollei NIES-4236 TaxID=2530354 RepID=A0AAV3X351_9CYAN|nr:hypothetical protein MiSe_11740 [Microseira wollei NIES-4236]
MRQYKTGLYRARNSQKEPLGFCPLIMPSQEKRQIHQKPPYRQP